MDGENNEKEISVLDLINQIYLSSPDSSYNKHADTIPEEDDEGCTEYKLKLVNPSEDRLYHLKTQMKFRIGEGKGEAFYNVGYQDNGIPLGLSRDDLESSMMTLAYLTNENKADLILLEVKNGLQGKVVELMVRARQRESFQLEVRIMVIGEYEAGKSTLVGALVTGKKDNGKGSIRMKVLQYQHERKSGRTSSLNYNVIGFDSAGNVKNHSLGQLGTSWEGVIEDSSKMLAF